MQIRTVPIGKQVVAKVKNATLIKGYLLYT